MRFYEFLADADDFSGLAKGILILLIILFSAISALVKKLNAWINRKRMEVDPRARRDLEREEAGRRRQPQSISESAAPPLAPAPPPPPPPPRVAPMAQTADDILRQLEAILPPEVRQARQRVQQMINPAPPPASPGQPPRPAIALEPPGQAFPSPQHDESDPYALPGGQPAMASRRAPLAPPAAPAPARASQLAREPAPAPARARVTSTPSPVPITLPARPKPSPVPQPAVGTLMGAHRGRRGADVALVAQLLHSRKGLKQAILAHEVLGPPKSAQMWEMASENLPRTEDSRLRDRGSHS